MMTAEQYQTLVVRTHLRRLELIAEVTRGSNACTRCGAETPPADLRLRSDAVPRLRDLARWTRINRLRRAFESGHPVEAICHGCEGRQFNATLRSYD